MLGSLLTPGSRVCIGPVTLRKDRNSAGTLVAVTVMRGTRQQGPGTWAPRKEEERRERSPSLGGGALGTLKGTILIHKPTFILKKLFSKERTSPFHPHPSERGGLLCSLSCKHFTCLGKLTGSRAKEITTDKCPPKTDIHTPQRHSPGN